MTIRNLEAGHADPASVAAIDQLSAAVATLVQRGNGAIAIADALVTVAARLMLDRVGKAGAALWLRDVMDDLRLGRVPSV